MLASLSVVPLDCLPGGGLGGRPPAMAGGPFAAPLPAVDMQADTEDVHMWEHEIHI